jgi:hypothetical protein
MPPPHSQSPTISPDHATHPLPRRRWEDPNPIGKRVKFQCRSLDVLVQKISEYIETNQCVQACGVDKNMIGISSYALLEPQVTSKLCSPACYHECSNIVDLYFNLAAGECKIFSKLGEKKKKKILVNWLWNIYSWLFILTFLLLSTVGVFGIFFMTGGFCSYYNHQLVNLADAHAFIFSIRSVGLCLPNRTWLF